MTPLQISASFEKCPICREVMKKDEMMRYNGRRMCVYCVDAVLDERKTAPAEKMLVHKIREKVYEEI